MYNVAMRISLLFTRGLFFLLSIFLFTTYTLAARGHTPENYLLGLLLGALVGGGLIGCDLLCRGFNLRAFNTATLGLFLGYLMGQALVLILHALFTFSTIAVAPPILELLNLALFLFGIYLGLILTLRSSDELTLSLPYIRLSPTGQRRRSLLLDASALADARIVDLAASGILDQTLIAPRFIVQELHTAAESADETTRTRARRSLETLKKLEAMPELALRLHDTDFPQLHESTAKLVRLARLLDANLLSSDITRTQMPSIEGIRLVNLHTLAHALKPLLETGETLRVKIQRPGKEPRQGVGYLDDGTMVVVNDGGPYIGETIDALVISVKHTTSGRIIFCNVPENHS